MHETARELLVLVSGLTMMTGRSMLSLSLTAGRVIIQREKKPAVKMWPQGLCQSENVFWELLFPVSIQTCQNGDVSLVNIPTDIYLTMQGMCEIRTSRWTPKKCPPVDKKLYSIQYHICDQRTTFR